MRYINHSGDESLRGEVKLLEGKVFAACSRLDESFDAFCKALECFDQLRNAERAIDAMYGQVQVRVFQNRIDESIILAAAALDRATRARNAKGEALALDSIGNVYAGNYAYALDCFSKSLAIEKSIGEVRAQAVGYFTRGMEIHESIGNREGQARL